MTKEPLIRSSFIQIGNITKAVKVGNTVTFHCTNARLQLSVRDERTIRVRLTFAKMFKPDSSFIILDPSCKNLTPFSLHEESTGWRLDTPGIRIKIERTPCRLSFLNKRGDLLNEDATPVGMKGTELQIQVNKVMPPNEHYYGFGHKGGPLDKRGTKMIMWNCYQLYEPDSDPLSVNIPFFIAIRHGIAYGLLLDTTVKSYFDMGYTTRRTYTITTDDSELSYYFIYGPDPKQVLYSYSQLTGTMPLPPRWILGNHQSRWSYPSEHHVLTIAKEFRRRKIPCDSIWFDIDYLDGYRMFTWNPAAFPNPKRLIADLKKDGFKSVVILDPGIRQDENYFMYIEGMKKKYFLRKQDGSLFRGTFWPGPSVFPDFTNPTVRRWWGEHHASLIDQGVAAFWIDLNEPQLFIDSEYEELAKVIHSDGKQTYPHLKLHNLYANFIVQATFEALQRFRPNHRPWILSRGGWVGIQRYAAVWTHDCKSNWEHLRVTVPMLLNLGMAGIPIVGADVGGFLYSPTPELFIRWLEMSVFTPFCRNHTIQGSADQEPWAFGPEVEEISRHYIAWRYRLLPYLYDLTYDASMTGIPLMRPLILEFPSDEHCCTIEDEFLLGPSLLVAPVLTEGVLQREVYLPAGEWVDPHSQQIYKGPITLTVSAPLNHCPTFVRRGSIIPLHPLTQHTGELVHELHLDVYPPPQGKAVEYRHYQDDGKSLNHLRGEYTITQFWCYTEDEEIRVDILDPEGSDNFSPQTYMLTLHTFEQLPHQAFLNSEILERVDDLKSLEQKDRVWLYQDHDKTVLVKFQDLKTRMEVRVVTK